MPLKSGKIAVIGAGVGGLATAARLASRGCDVEVFEKLPECGGRAHMIEDKGFKFDTGPSFVMMPDFFKEVFDYCNEDIKAHLDLKVLDPSYKIYFSDNDTLTVFRDSEKTKQELEKLEKGSSASFDKFISEISKIYSSVNPLLYKNFTPFDAANPAYWGLLFKLQPFKTYWQLAKQFFKSDKICYAMTFEAMFIGLSPYKTPAFYSVISYTDHVEKISHPIGGMYEIPKALENICVKNKVKINYSSEVTGIEEKKDKVFLKVNGSVWEFDKVVINADYSQAKETLLKSKIPEYQYSCSVYLIYLGLKKKVKGIEHHNLFFAKDLNNNLKDIFEDKAASFDPSFYVHAPTVTDPSLAPKDKEIAYILVPVPNLDGSSVDNRFCDHQLRKIVFDKINEKLNIDIETLIEVEHRFYPDDFIKRYNIKFGATFGLAHTLFQSAFFRPNNVDNKNKNIYYVGASVQPGGGLPPVIASSRIVADLILGEK